MGYQRTLTRCSRAVAAPTCAHGYAEQHHRPALRRPQGDTRQLTHSSPDRIAQPPRAAAGRCGSPRGSVVCPPQAGGHRQTPIPPPGGGGNAAACGHWHDGAGPQVESGSEAAVVNMGRHPPAHACVAQRTGHEADRGSAHGDGAVPG